MMLSAMVMIAASAAQASADPTLKANPNPVIVPAGQTQSTTTLTWNTEGAGGYVWLSVDGGEETQITSAGAAVGSLGATGEVGKSYVFKLYTVDKRLLASVTVTVAAQQSAGQPQAAARPGRVRSTGRVTKDDDVVAIDSKSDTHGTAVLLTKPVNNGQGFRLICRAGPGLRISWPSPFSGLWDEQLMLLNFIRSPQPPDSSGRNLQPGECSPVNFQLRSVDPTQIHHKVDHNGEIVGSGRIIGSGQGDREFFPGFPGDNLSLTSFERLEKYAEYLKDPKHYWTLFVYDVRETDDHYFGMTNAEYWKPESNSVSGPLDTPRTFPGAQKR